MIIDVHSHAWKFPDHFNDDFRQQASRKAKAGVELDLTVEYDAYRNTAPAETRTVVFGGKARLSGLWVDDRYVADYVNAHPETLIGYMSLDPTQTGWQDEMRTGYETLGLRGIKLLPMYAGFQPDDPSLDPLWDFATQHRLPVLLHTGTTFVAQAPPGLHAAATHRPGGHSLSGSQNRYGSPFSSLRRRVGGCDPKTPARLCRYQRAALPPVSAVP